jgi:hypothetical protein
MTLEAASVWARLAEYGPVVAAAATDLRMAVQQAVNEAVTTVPATLQSGSLAARAVVVVYVGLLLVCAALLSAVSVSSVWRVLASVGRTLLCALACALLALGATYWLPRVIDTVG